MLPPPPKKSLFCKPDKPFSFREAYFTRLQWRLMMRGGNYPQPVSSSNSFSHSPLSRPLPLPLHFISVHVTIGVDTQDVTWEHAMHALIDSQPPVSPHLFLRLSSSVESYTPSDLRAGTCTRVQSSSVRPPASHRRSHGFNTALSSWPAAAAAAAATLFARIYPTSYAFISSVIFS